MQGDFIFSQSEKVGKKKSNKKIPVQKTNRQKEDEVVLEVKNIMIERNFKDKEITEDFREEMKVLLSQKIENELNKTLKTTWNKISSLVLDIESFIGKNAILARVEKGEFYVNEEGFTLAQQVESLIGSQIFDEGVESDLARLAGLIRSLNKKIVGLITENNKLNWRENITEYDEVKFEVVMEVFEFWVAVEDRYPVWIKEAFVFHLENR